MPQNHSVASKTSAPAEPTTPGQWFVLLVVVGMLLGFGATIIASGYRAIDTQYFESNWRSSNGFSLGIIYFGQSKSGILIYEGWDAIRQGIGQIAFGTMFVTWGLTLFSGQILRRFKKSDSLLTKTMGWTSLLCLIVAAACFYPVWETFSIPFYAVVGSTILFLFSVITLKFKNWSHYFFPGLILAAIIAGVFSIGIAVAMVLGILVSVFLLVHLLLLFPAIQKSFPREPIGDSQ